MTAFPLKWRPIGERAFMTQRERDAMRQRVIRLLDRERMHPGIDNAVLASDLLNEILDMTVDV